MELRLFGHRGHKKKQYEITYEQVMMYLERKDVAPVLIQECVNFLRTLARDNNERCIGTTTMNQVTDDAWHVTEAELVAVYQAAPIEITTYVEDTLCEGTLPSERDLTKHIAGYSSHAKQAYIFLSVMATRAMYAIIFEPKAKWQRELWEHEAKHRTAI